MMLGPIRSSASVWLPQKKPRSFTAHASCSLMAGALLSTVVMEVNFPGNLL